MLIHEYLEVAESLSPGKAALVIGSDRVSYRDLLARVRAGAAGLLARGVGRGDRIAIYLDNGAEAVVAIYAALRAGAVFVMINPLTKADKLAYLINDSRALVLITDSSFSEAVAGALAGCPSLETVAYVDDAPPTPGDGRCRPWSELAAVAGPDSVTVQMDDLASIIYTSGSTGNAKGVMLTHRNMSTAASLVSAYLGLVADDIIFCALPLAFDYGLYQVLMAVQVAATVVLERSFAFPLRALEILARERVTVFPGVPTMFVMLLGVPSLSRFDLSSLRLITNTAAALPETRIGEIKAAFPSAMLYSMYGLTECKRVTYLPPEELERRPGSVGRGIPGTDVWLVDEHGRRLPNGSQGELVIRGDHVMRGYWEKPEETALRLRSGPNPGETVLYSGDVFRTDEDGYLYFVARKDDIIKTRGEKVSPREVENALHAFPGVSDAAVVGVPDPVLGEAVKAFVVLREGASATERELIRHCLGRLESFMVPKSVEFVASLPTTVTGKVYRRGLLGQGSQVAEGS